MGEIAEAIINGDMGFDGEWYGNGIGVPRQFSHRKQKQILKPQKPKHPINVQILVNALQNPILLKKEGEISLFLNGFIFLIKKGKETILESRDMFMVVNTYNNLNVNKDA